MPSDLSTGASAPVQLHTTNPGELRQATAEGRGGGGRRAPRVSGAGGMYQNRGTADRGGEGELGASDRPGTEGLRERPGSCQAARPPALRAPLTPCRSRTAPVSRPRASGSGQEPRRQQEPRTTGPGPATRGSAALTFLPPRKSLRRVPLRPPQSPPSPYGTIDVSAPKVHFQAL